jgi:hypothetical protein
VKPEDRVQVDRIDDVVVVTLERTGFAGPARTVLLLALALPWLIVGPAFVLFVGGTVPGWVVAVAAVVSGLIGFGLSLVSFVLATRSHHFEVGEETIRFWTDAPVGSVQREWPREGIDGFEVALANGRSFLFIVAKAGGRLALPVTREAPELQAFANALEAVLETEPEAAAG